MKWTKDQQKIIDSRNCNLLVSAAAGSGKTAVLVERIIQMICDEVNPIDVDQLLVVTFTKAAAAQMRDKIAKALEKKLEENPDNEHFLKQVNLVNRANILTIDSFCFQVVKEHFYAISIDPGIRVGDTGEIALLRDEVLASVIEKCYETDSDFVDFSESFSADKNDKNVEKYMLKIYEVCSSYPRPQEWLKNAKNALRVEDEEQFSNLPLIRSFFEQAHIIADDIRKQILEALEDVRRVDGPIHLEKTFLSDIQIVDDILSAKKYSHFHDLGNRKFDRIASGKKGTFDVDVAEQLKEVRDKYKKKVTQILEPFSIPFSELLSQNQKQAPRLEALLNAVEVFSEAFKKEKYAKNILEFSDVEHCALQILCEGYDEEGNAIPSEIGKEMSSEFVEIMIDEYQDSNFLQEAILRCVSKVNEGKNNIFMVGDVKQSIYGFRMARPDLFMEKYHTYLPEENSANRKLLLKNNFRSRENVLEAVNYLFYQIMGADLGGIDYTEDESLVCGNTFPEGMDDAVELLIGESKEFNFTELEKDKTDHGDVEELNDKLEDIGKKELEASMVANRILSMMNNADGTQMVTDEVTGKLRNIRYSDIVILFRAPSSYQREFYEILMAKGIPVRIQNGTGYFDTTEIRMLLSFLKVIDNPLDDVEMAAVLRSYFGNCDNNEIAYLILVKKGLDGIQTDSEKKKYSLFEVTKRFSNLEQDEELQQVLQQQQLDFKELDCIELMNKCAKLISRIQYYMEQKIIVSVTQLMRYIFQDGYIYYVESMPEGNRRANNLELFLQEAVKCENGGFCGIFDFLQYVEKIQEKSISLDGDSGQDEDENVVRIMSIHKSKGLEFPIVFVSGIGKQFNQMDTKTPLIIHADYFLGAKYRDLQTRRANDTFIRNAMTTMISTQNIAEELRVFYVALTRAKEKLILTGVTGDVPALVRKFEHIAKRKERTLSFVNVQKATSYLDLVVMACIRNASFEKAMHQVKERRDRNDDIVSAKYECEAYLEHPEVKLRVEVFDFVNLAVQHLKRSSDKVNDRSVQLETWKRKDARYVDQMIEALNWRYEQEHLTKQKAKLSVTEIKRMYETDFEASDVIEMEVREEYQPPLPRFIQPEKEFDAATKGTWVHKTMELFDFVNITDLEGIESFFETMIGEQRIPDSTPTFLKAEMVNALVNSSLGKRMREAAKKGDLYKEKQFIVGVSEEKLTGAAGEKQDNAGRNRILVQGIMDAYFIENDSIVLIDYKTDFAKPGDEERLAKRYYTQLLYYRDTLEQLTGKKVAEAYIYSFALNKAIPIL